MFKIGKMFEKDSNEFLSEKVVIFEEFKCELECCEVEKYV